MLKSLCVIPARSGSKGLVDKNVKILGNKTVLQWTIDSCIESGIFDAVYVATDSDEYTTLAKSLGAMVPELEPAEMAGDFISSTEPVLWIEELLGGGYDLLWCMQPTSPFRLPEDIKAAYKLLQENPSCNFVLSVNEIDPHYFNWALDRSDDGFVELHFGQETLVDRSLLPKAYRPNGAIKAGRAEKVREYRHFFGDHIMCVDMPEERSIHIRSQLDFDLCEVIAQRGLNVA